MEDEVNAVANAKFSSTSDKQSTIDLAYKTIFEPYPILSGHSSSLLEANSHTIICRNVVGG